MRAIWILVVRVDGSHRLGGREDGGGERGHRAETMSLVVAHTVVYKYELYFILYGAVTVQYSDGTRQYDQYYKK